MLTEQQLDNLIENVPNQFTDSLFLICISKQLGLR